MQTTLGRLKSGESVAGSTAKTSKAAPATWPDLSASASAASSTRPPRAQLMMRTPGLVSRKGLGREDVAGRVRQGDVKCDEIGASEQVVEVYLLDAELVGAVFTEERVVGDDLHPEAAGAVADDRADVACTDDAERLAGEFDAHEADFSHLPAWVEAFASGFAGDGEHHGDGVFGGCDGVAEGRVHHDDALF